MPIDISAYFLEWLYYASLFLLGFILSVGVPIFVAWGRLHKLNIKKKKEIRLLFIAIAVLCGVNVLVWFYLLPVGHSKVRAWGALFLVTLITELLLISILVISDKNGKFVKKMAATSLGFNTIWCFLWLNFTRLQYNSDKTEANVYEEMIHH